MEFVKALELQKMEIVVDSQVQLAKIKRSRQSHTGQLHPSNQLLQLLNQKEQHWKGRGELGNESNLEFKNKPIGFDKRRNPSAKMKTEMLEIHHARHEFKAGKTKRTMQE
ncbi:hypothetical protein MUK42_36450 [Musa troglodytarum]|uniref:Uncharacterized protein n=1 Tax=Musa troglodytarum TaxID=320322 RepID=A0A9E7EAL7_9LILI|nr:hypothetical protein MUK42_36450 [Musa troglodytarum]